MARVKGTEMKSMFGIVGLLLAVLIVAIVARKQFGATAVPAAQGPAVALPALPPGATAQRVQQQYKDALTGAMQQPRASDAGQ